MWKVELLRNNEAIAEVCEIGIRARTKASVQGDDKVFGDLFKQGLRKVQKSSDKFRKVQILYLLKVELLRNNETIA